MAEEQHDLERDLISAVLTCYHTTRLSEISAEAHIQAKPLFRQAVEALRRVPAVEAEPRRKRALEKADRILALQPEQAG